MKKTHGDQELEVLVIDGDSERAQLVCELAEQLGVPCELGELPCFPEPFEPDSQPRLVFLSESILAQLLVDDHQSVRDTFGDLAVVVAMMEVKRRVDSLNLLGAGLDLLIYHPIGAADIERSVTFAQSILNESPAEARDRLRRMNALHQLAIGVGQQSNTSDWLQRLVVAGQRILDCSALAFWALDREEGRVRCAASIGLSDHYITEAESRSSQLVKRYANLPQRVESLWMEQESSEEGSGVVAPEAAEAEGIFRIAWMPVRDSSGVYGHMSFYFNDQESYQRYDLVLADAFSAIVTAALHSQTLLSEISRSNRLYREQVELSPDGVLVCQMDGTIERANFSVESVTGRDRYSLLGTSVKNLFADSSEIPWDDWIALDLESRADAVETWLVRPDKSRRRVSCYARRLELPAVLAFQQSDRRMQIILEDVTVQARRLVELELLHDLTRLFSESRPIEDGYELVVSRLYDFFHYRLVSVGVLVEDFYLENGAFRTHGQAEHMPTYFDATMGICGRAIRENRSILVKDVSRSPDYYSIDDEVRSELVALIRSEGKPVGLIDIQCDESMPLSEADLQLAEGVAAHLGLLIDQTRSSERLQNLAMTDPLTGVANRRAFLEALHNLVTNPESPPTGLFLVEIDRFKEVNDRYGHLFGDEMLIQVAERLERQLRTGDMVARYGGDELAVIFNNLRSERALEVAERLRRAISESPFTCGDRSVHLTVSIGIAHYPLHGTSPDRLIAEADRAMYQAKLLGRNRVVGELKSSSD